MTKMSLESRSVKPMAHNACIKISYIEETLLLKCGNG